MAERWTLIGMAGLVMAACATATFEGTPIAEWAGAYGLPQPPPPKEDPNDDGEGLGPWFFWRPNDVLEIRPISPTRARIDVMVFQRNGHQCSVSGPADLEDGRLVFRETNEYGLCQFSIRREKNRSGEDELTITQDRDVSNSCGIYCGANVRLSTSIPASTRHTLPRTPVTELE